MKLNPVDASTAFTSGIKALASLKTTAATAARLLKHSCLLLRQRAAAGVVRSRAAPEQLFASPLVVICSRFKGEQKPRQQWPAVRPRCMSAKTASDPLDLEEGVAYDAVLAEIK